VHGGRGPKGNLEGNLEEKLEEKLEETCGKSRTENQDWNVRGGSREGDDSVADTQKTSL